MALWTIAEATANIAALKIAYQNALGQAEREKVQEGNSVYETVKLVQQIRKDLEQAYLDLTEAQMDAGVVTKKNNYVPNRWNGL